MTEEEKKATEVQEPSPIDADSFRARFVKGQLVTAPSESIYRIRPIAPHHFLNAWTERLMSFLSDEDIGKEISEDKVKKLIPVSERAAGMNAIRPALIFGVIEPDVVEPKALGRKLLKTELSVDDLMTNMDDALFLYTQIHLLSRKGSAQLGDGFQDKSGSGT